MTIAFRRGAVGAMMDEYERAAAELLGLIDGLSDFEFEAVRDRETSDDACRSIQTVLNHVVRAGYGYASQIREAFGAGAQRPEVTLGTRRESQAQIAQMLAYTVATLEDKWLFSDDEIMAVRIHARWGPTYDLEQWLEHAIVHVLRHRRQIKRFLSEPQFRPSAA
jgi:uncharacterized damage-inducible protein DinB